MPFYCHYAVRLATFLPQRGFTYRCRVIQENFLSKLCRLKFNQRYVIQPVLAFRLQPNILYIFMNTSMPSYLLPSFIHFHNIF
jgi:hypothetical protein